MRRPRNKMRGIEAEKRTKKHLEKYGSVEVIGRPWKNPDLFWWPKYKLSTYALEVKGVKGITAGRAGRIWITKPQWEEILRCAKEHNALPAVIVEIDVHIQKLYFLLNQRQVEDKMRATSASFTIWQVIQVGERID